MVKRVKRRYESTTHLGEDWAVSFQSGTGIGAQFETDPEKLVNVKGEPKDFPIRLAVRRDNSRGELETGFGHGHYFTSVESAREFVVSHGYLN